MSETPPPYANYPRHGHSPGSDLYGSASALRSLSEGYFGLSRVFAINIAIALGSRLLTMGGRPQSTQDVLAMSAGIALVVGLVIGFLTYGPNKKIGEGAGWSPAQPVIASVLMGINSALCCGVVGYVVMQAIASNHIKRYGVRAGFFGLKKKEVEARIADLEASPR